MAINMDDLFLMLSWNSDEKIQSEGRKIAGQLKYLSVFLQPLEDKSVWENCAKILNNKSDIELEPYLFRLFAWLQDLNWPGAFIILSRLKNFSPSLILSAFSFSIKKAIKLDDQVWLGNLIEFMQNLELCDMLPTNLKETVTQYLKE